MFFAVSLHVPINLTTTHALGKFFRDFKLLLASIRCGALETILGNIIRRQGQILEEARVVLR
ncbi:hypothetical protein D7X55_42435, partial [Corallococcus sp. AB049A]